MHTITKKIALEGTRFFAFHGFYPQEQLAGSEFILDIEVEMDMHDHGYDELAHTVNYESLYEIASVEMKKTRKLLESVAYAIIDEIKQEFPVVSAIRVCIRKASPMLPGQTAFSKVELIYER